MVYRCHRFDKLVSVSLYLASHSVPESLQHRCNNNVYRTPEYFTTNFRTSCFIPYIFLGLANELFRMWHLCVALFHKKSCTLQHVFFTRYQQCSLHLTSEVCGYLDCVYSSLLMSHGKVECKRILKFRQ